MKRRNFVKGILGLTGIAASGASVAMDPVKTEELGRPLHGISPDGIKWEFTESNQSLSRNYEGHEAQKRANEAAKRIVDRLEVDYAKFMIRNSHLFG